MITARQYPDGGLYEMSASEVAAAFDSAAQQLLGISGNEFVERWKRGYFGLNPDTKPGVMEVASLMPKV